MLNLVDVLSAYGLKQTEVDHSVFVRHIQSGSLILAVYVDDIVITGSERTGIVDLKQYFSKHFFTKDLGKLGYLLGIEVARSKAGISLYQRKYVTDFLEQTGLLGEMWILLWIRL